jgi:histone H3/H4
MAEEKGDHSLEPVRPLPVVPTANSELSRLLQQVDAELKQIDPTPFSTSAFTALQSHIATYIAELMSESMRDAKRHQLDTVSEMHVERAADFLITGSGRKLFRHIGTIGGVLLGAAVSNLLAMAASNTVTFSSAGLTVALGIVGAFAVAIHIARD